MASSDATAADVLSEAGLELTIDDVSTVGAVVRVPGAQAMWALTTLKAAGYDFLIDLFGIDTGEAIDVVYMLRSTTTSAEAIVKITHDYASTLTSIWAAYPAALTAERECAEMFGLTLAGHPNPKRLLTTEAIGAPLLKSTPIRTVEEARDR